MVVVDGKAFKDLISKVCSSKKQIMYFSFNGEYLEVQTRKSCVIDASIQVLQSSVEKASIMVMYTGAAALLSDSDKVELSITKKVLTIQQGTLTWRLEEVPEDKTTYTIDGEMPISFDVTELTKVDRCVRSTLLVAKEYGDNTCNVDLFNNVAYISSKSSVVSLNFKSPDCKLTSTVVKEICYFSSGATVERVVQNESGKYIRFYFRDGRVITAPYSLVKETELEVAMNLFNTSKFFGRVNCYDVVHRCKSIIGVFKSVSAELLFYKNVLGIFLSDSNINCTIGSVGLPEFSMRITLGQLQLLSNIFYQGSQIEVKCISNYVVLTSNGTSLVLAGVRL